MVLSSSNRVTTHFELSEPRDLLSFREIMVLTIGAISNPIGSKDLFTLTRTLASRLENEMKFDLPSYTTFLKMISKLLKGSIIQQQPLPNMNGYGIMLTVRGLGELDSIMYGHQFIAKPWTEFRRLALLAVS